MQSDYITSLTGKGIRADNRSFTEYRKISIEYGVSAKSADGSARVKLGETEVVAGVKFEVGAPFPDTPDEGTIIVNVELTPIASPEFALGPPRIDSIELSRVIDRGIRESKTLDFMSLCIEPGNKIWLVFIDVYPVNDAGNLFDVAALAALAALKDARFPKYDSEAGKIDYASERTKKGLTLKTLPLSCTIVKIGNSLLVDPTADESNACEARLTVASTDDGSVCALQKGGDAPLTIEDVSGMIDLAIEKGKELRGQLK